MFVGPAIRGGSMERWGSIGSGSRTARSAVTLCFALFVLAAVLTDCGTAKAIPAFARKYGMPCSSCHEAWPKLSPFGQQFKDNGYQMGNDRDAPIFQQAAYWPISLRITPNWHVETANHVVVDGPNESSTVANIKTNGFDYTGMDLLTAGTLAKNISFLWEHFTLNRQTCASAICSIPVGSTSK
jgi:hypothetical protein